MKKIIAVILCLLFVATFMVACKKDVDGSEETSGIVSGEAEETTEKKTVNPDRGYKGTQAVESTEEETSSEVAGGGEGGGAGDGSYTPEPVPRDPLETSFYY